MKNRDKCVQYAEVWRAARKVGGWLSDDCCMVEVPPREWEKQLYERQVVC